MVTLLLVTRAALAFSWIVFVSLFVQNWRRIREQRRRDGEIWEGRLIDRPSRRGLYLQGGMALAFIPGADFRPAWLLVAAVMLAVASTVFVRSALTHLGRHWRVNTVVTTDHELITTGPYSLVRHPVYTALLGMAVATGIIVAPWLCVAAAVALYSLGTEIRVRAEDALLERRFGKKQQEFRRNTKAWIPCVR